MGACMLSVGTCACLSCAYATCVRSAYRLPHVPAFSQFFPSTGRIGFQERLVNGRELPRSWALGRRRQVGLKTLSQTTTGSPLSASLIAPCQLRQVYRCSQGMTCSDSCVQTGVTKCQDCFTHACISPRSGYSSGFASFHGGLIRDKNTHANTHSRYNSRGR
jgi:hypothetical protein